MTDNQKPFEKSQGKQETVSKAFLRINRKPVMSATPPTVLDLTVAFRPFENSIFDMRGLLTIVEDLTLIERSLFRGKEGPISTKARDFTTSSVITIFEDLEKTGLMPTTEAKQLKFLKDLVSYLKSLPVVRVTLAFAPTDTFLTKISNDISSLLSRKAIIDLTVDEYIVGGAVFEYGGKLNRQTLDAKLEEVLAKQVGGLA